MNSKYIGFRAVPPLDAPLFSRVGEGESEGEIARRDLTRYYALLADELNRVSLTENEASLIVDALNGTLIEPSSYRLIWMEIEDALEDGLAEKWGADGPALVEKLKALPAAQLLAIADACERYWKLSDVRMPKALRIVGLVRD